MINYVVILIRENQEKNTLFGGLLNQLEQT